MARNWINNCPWGMTARYSTQQAIRQRLQFRIIPKVVYVSHWMGDLETLWILISLINSWKKNRVAMLTCLNLFKGPLRFVWVRIKHLNVWAFNMLSNFTIHYFLLIPITIDSHHLLVVRGLQQTPFHSTCCCSSPFRYFVDLRTICTRDRPVLSK